MSQEEYSTPRESELGRQSANFVWKYMKCGAECRGAYKGSIT